MYVVQCLPQIVEHKQQVLLEEKRKKAMDMHLEFIVDQTAKYSNWLVKGLGSHTPSEPSLQSVASSHDGRDQATLSNSAVDGLYHMCIYI